MTGTKYHTWQSSKRKRKQAHFMESEVRAYCGRPLINTKALPPDWKPEDHPDYICPTCMEWYRLVARPHGVKKEVVEPSTA